VAPGSTSPRRALLHLSTAARYGRINQELYLLEGVDLQSSNDDLIAWAGYEDPEARSSPKERGRAEDNLVAREAELAAMKPLFHEEDEEAAEKKKKAEEKLEKKLEKKRFENPEPPTAGSPGA
jgi:hypothetical protein